MLIKNSKVYDFLKWFALVVLPSCGAAYARLAQIWGLPYSSQIPETIMTICMLIGAILGISNATYYKSGAGAAKAFSEAYTDFLDVEPTDDNSEEGVG